MNERIQKLAKQAGLEGSNGHYEYDWFDPEKFAELLVKECVMTISEDDGATHHRELLFSHFGVK